MEGDSLYAEEKLRVAQLTMAIGQGKLRERLRSAFISFHTVTEVDLPEYLQADYTWIRDSLTAESATGDEETVEASLKEMSDSQAEDIARRICEVANKLQVYNRVQYPSWDYPDQNRELKQDAGE